MVIIYQWKVKQGCYLRCPPEGREPPGGPAGRREDLRASESLALSIAHTQNTHAHTHTHIRTAQRGPGQAKRGHTPFFNTTTWEVKTIEALWRRYKLTEIKKNWKKLNKNKKIFVWGKGTHGGTGGGSDTKAQPKLWGLHSFCVMVSWEFVSESGYVVDGGEEVTSKVQFGPTVFVECRTMAGASLVSWWIFFF